MHNQITKGAKSYSSTRSSSQKKKNRVMLLTNRKFKEKNPSYQKEKETNTRSTAGNRREVEKKRRRRELTCCNDRPRRENYWKNLRKYFCRNLKKNLVSTYLNWACAFSRFFTIASLQGIRETTCRFASRLKKRAHQHF